VDAGYREALNRDRGAGAWFGLAKIYQTQRKYEEASRRSGRRESGAGKRNSSLFARALAPEIGRRKEAQREVLPSAEEIDDAAVDKKTGRSGAIRRFRVQS